MLPIELPADIEKHLRAVVRDNYDGDLQAAITSFLKLHEKYGWKEQLCEDVKSIRSEVRRKGGIKARAIDDAITRYRSSLGASDARALTEAVNIEFLQSSLF
jgi:flavodoxin